MDDEVKARTSEAGSEKPEWKGARGGLSILASGF
jgi:hypothetical protein